MTYPYKAALFAERNKNQAYNSVITALEEAARDQSLTRRHIAGRIGRKPPQVTKWLSGPSNWTLDTISDLLFAIDATMDYNVIFNKDRAIRNEFHPLSPQQINTKNFLPSVFSATSVSQSDTKNTNVTANETVLVKNIVLK
jgi:hypothetical protein